MYFLCWTTGWHLREYSVFMHRTSLILTMRFAWMVVMSYTCYMCFVYSNRSCMKEAGHLPPVVYIYSLWIMYSRCPAWYQRITSTMDFDDCLISFLNARYFTPYKPGHICTDGSFQAWVWNQAINWHKYACFGGCRGFTEQFQIQPTRVTVHFTVFRHFRILSSLLAMSHFHNSIWACTFSCDEFSILHYFWSIKWTSTQKFHSPMHSAEVLCNSFVI